MLVKADEPSAWGRGVYGSADALRLVNFAATGGAEGRRVSRHTLARWLRGYAFTVGDSQRHRSEPLWRPDYAANDDAPLEISFRDLMELRFVKVLRDAGVGLPTIRKCFERAVELIGEERPFSTRTFRTDGLSIFLDITEDAEDEALIDLRRRQVVFRTFLEPSFKDLDFEDGSVARWFPLGERRRSLVVDPTFALGRPISAVGFVPTAVLALAASIERSVDRVAQLYEVPAATVRDAIVFETKLAA